MESMLGDALSKHTIEGRFRKGLHKWIRGKLTAFADLPYEEYKHKAEVADQEAKEQRIGPYAVTPSPRLS